MTLDQLGSAPPDESSLMCSWSEIHPDSRILWSSSAGPVAISRPVGAGRVTAFSIEPTQFSGPILGLELGARVKSIHEALATGNGHGDIRAQHFWSSKQISPDFQGIKLLPKPLLVILIISAFVAVVGPVNIYLLRKYGRLELAWVTIPALSILFFLAIYGYGLKSKGEDQHYLSAGRISLSPVSTKALHRWNDIQFSPRRRYTSSNPGREGFIHPWGTSTNIRQSNIPNGRPFQVVRKVRPAVRPAKSVPGAVPDWMLVRTAYQCCIILYRNG
jgi:hypothetical protein